MPEHPKLCGAMKKTYIFSHYAYGDPLPIWARYFDSAGEPVGIKDAAPVYIRCQREAEHPGKHLALDMEPWPHEE